MNSKQYTREITCSIIAVALTVLGIVLFALGFSTGYYIYGQMNSVSITAALCGAVALAIAAIFCLKKFPDAWWPKLLTFGVTALLAYSALTLIGDRVEGIGNCILTDYDSGHGGEEAIYMSLGGSVAMLLAMVFNIIGAFGDKTSKKPGVTKIALGSTAAVAGIAVLIVSLVLGGIFAPKDSKTAGGSSGPSEGPASADSGALAGTYTVKLSGAEGNVDLVQDYQFQCGNLSGLMNYDTRLTLDLTLTLNPDGTYVLFSDAYAIEGGKRAVIGDDTGLGMISQMTAEGTYTVNEDGTVTTSPATHAVFELALDTYSSQMRGPASYMLGEKEMADGKYDSADYPVILDRVPETAWKLGNGTIEAYGKPAAGIGTYTVKLSGAEGNVDLVQDYQFQCGNLSGLMNYDTRLTLDLTLTLNPDGTYALFSDAYAIEGGKRAVIGDDTGLGMISQMTAEGTYTVNEDGTVTTSPATHAVFELALDTYSSQMRGPASYMLGEKEMADGKYDSADYPVILDRIPETVWTLNSDMTIAAYTGAASATPAEQPEEQPSEQPSEAPGAASVTIPSDDEGTTMTFRPDGTYTFEFASYNITEDGTYTYEDGKLTVINPNGAEASAEGDPLKLHYVSAKSDMLTGDYTIPVSTFDFGAGKAAPAASFEAFTIPSDDGGTEITFNPDGTYRFWFASYSVEDLGTFTFENGVLTLTDKNGVQYTGEGDPIKLHYGFSGAPDQLTGEYTIPAANFQSAEAAPSASFEAFTVPSDDGGTEITFNPDGTYRFWFASYSVEDLGTFTFENGVLTLTDKNGVQYTGEGDPIKLHYGFSGAPDQLTGEYTIPAANFQSAEAAPSASFEAFTVPSDDGGTEITFNPDGTYRFWFASYSVEDLGTFTFENGVLTLTDKNGVQYTGEGDPIKLHYGFSGAPDQLTGEYTIDPAKFGSAEAASAAEPVTVTSMDGGTTITFNGDGTYRFFFEAYSVEDTGTYTLEDGILTVVNGNGLEMTPANGVLHYVASQSDMLTGDYAVTVAGAPIPSADGGTELTIYADGTYRFWFASYSIEDKGTYTCEDGQLTFVNGNGLEMTPADGVLHYVASQSDMLTGDFVISSLILK